MIEVAIVGGGPAGSHCAYHLAKNGIQPVIFDHSHPREKPCGGLISPIAQRTLPFLKSVPVERAERDKIHLLSPYGKKVCLSTGGSRLLCFSRLKLDQFLVNKATDEGAELVEEKVIALQTKGDSWRIKTTRKWYSTKKVIGADGVNSLVRKTIIGPINQRDKGVCCGYLVRGLEEEDLTMKFLFHKVGYIWVFPRVRNTSLGIGCVKASQSYGLKRLLDIFIEQHYPHVEKISKWAALIPHVKDKDTFCIPLAGPNWALIGDAAGHVNTIFGEGIMYALLDGELAARAVKKDNLQLFNSLWKESYGWSLYRSIKLARWICNKSILELYCRYIKFHSILSQQFSFG